jgi:hypothetical protein
MESQHLQRILKAFFEQQSQRVDSMTPSELLLAYQYHTKQQLYDKKYVIQEDDLAWMSLGLLMKNAYQSSNEMSE